ncbi:MAG: hypothetical protein WA890_22380, partial [Micromonospora sp.]
PAAPGQFAPPSPAGQPLVPAQPGFTPPGGQPWGAYPGDPAAQPQGWAWPAGAYPGQPPMPGQPYGQPYGWHPGLDPHDPLVNPPYAGIGGWFSRCTGAVRRGWRQLLPIMLLTHTVPAAVIAVLSIALVPTGQPIPRPDGTTALPGDYFPSVFTFYGALLLASLIFGPLQSTGWAAGTWVVTRQAVGERVGVGAALRYGLRRALGLWGWTIVASLLIMVGVCVCFLPGIYVAAAVALFGPVYLFERKDPMGRSFGTLHRRFGMVFGRVALVAVALVAAGVVNFVVGRVNQVVFGLHPLGAPGTAVGAVALAVLGAVLVTPAYLAQLVGLVATYAEQRAQDGPVNSARLAAELG